ncbi:diguanylate cyclase (GGDEF) domain-containing protein [Pseudomonas asplenii]|uniref:diguanylate cyclase n=1 Tax=Pseudomonas asplenii TaxID=53407 RepID=A0A1H1PA78_9PSED|nr:sensor domain-containing diguanylate cyclase [Pseudomonas asplenii]SDS07529.1 diguanylate cyclase (GGDEF) domain-containing protein [Pseudomonas asplenii]
MPRLLLILGSGLSVSAILGIVIYLLIRERGSAELVAIRAATNIVQLIDADVLRNAELYDKSLLDLITASRREDLKHVSPQIRHLALFDSATAAPNKGDILLLDKDGEVIADSSSVTPRTGNYADRAYFKAHIENPSDVMMISQPFLAREKWVDWRISFSRRVSSPEGEFLGVARAAIRLSYFNELFRTLNVGASSTVNLLSSDGILLAQEPLMNADMVGKDFSQRPNFQRIVSEGNGSFSAISGIDGKQRLYTFSRVGDLPLIVVVALSGEEVYSSWWRTTWLVGSATGGLCVGLLWLSWLLARELQRRQRAEQELAELATTDALTGIANRRALDQTLLLEWNRAQRSGQPLSLLMIDADHFKAFNDRHGHPMGDEALRQIARVIGDSIRRPGDLVARYGGEEFAVILPQTDETGACCLAEKISSAIRQMPPLLADACPITVSIGVSTQWVSREAIALGARIEQLLEDADQALYQAKRNGRDQLVHARDIELQR